MTEAAAPALTSRLAEESLLASVAVSSNVDVAETLAALDTLGLTADVFAFDDTRMAYGLMREFLQRGDPCHVRQMEFEAKRRAISIGWLIAAEAQSSGVLSFAKAMADELRELSGRRRIKALALDLKYRAENMTSPVDETVVHLSGQLNALVSGASARIQTLDSKMPLVSTQLDGVSKGELGGVVKTGMEAWDRNVGGWWPTLNVIGGHPSRGKSGLVAAQILSLARQAEAGDQGPGIIFTLEDPAEWLVYRYLAHISRVPGFLLRTRELNAEQQEAVGAAWPEVERLGRHIMFDERSRLKPAQLVAAARDAILTRGARWVVADHAGEFAYTRGHGDRHDLDVAEGLSEMRSVAKSYGVPFVLLSQLSRQAKPPHSMQDFKNASAVEEVARMAAIVWTHDGNPLEPIVSIVKNTNGKRDFDMKFQLDATSGLLVEAPPPSRAHAEQESFL